MPSILIVDDDNYLRGLYVTVFKEAGFQVLDGKDGLEGLQLARTAKPDVIFTGIMMPNLAGFEMMQKLKDDPKTASIPVMISSHLGREQDRITAETLGAKAFFVKGQIAPEDIVKLVVNILEGQVEQKVFRVRIDPHELDGPKLQRELKADSSLMFELRSDIASRDQEFRARYLPSGSVSPDVSPSGEGSAEELTKVLKDLETKLGQ